MTNVEAYKKKFFKNIAVNKVKKIVNANMVDKFLTNNKTEVRSPFLVMNGRRLNVPEVKKVQETMKAQAKELQASNARRKKQENVRARNLAQKYRVSENFVRSVDLNENKVREERKRLNTNRRQQLIKDYLKIQTTPTNAQERTALNSVAVQQADKYAKIYGKNSKQVEKDISDILKKLKTDEIFFIDPATNKNRIPKMLNLKYGINRTGIANDLKTLKTLSDEEKKILETSVVRGVPGALNKAKKVDALRKQIRAVKGLSTKDVDDYIQLAGREPEQLEKVLIIAKAASELAKTGQQGKLAFSEGQLGRSIRNKTLNGVVEYVNKVKKESTQAVSKKMDARAEINKLKRLSTNRKRQFISELTTANVNNVLMRAIREDAMKSLQYKSEANVLRTNLLKVQYGPEFKNKLKELVASANARGKVKANAKRAQEEANAKKAREEAEARKKAENERKAAQTAEAKAEKERKAAEAKAEKERKAAEAKAEKERKAAEAEARKKAAEAEAKRKAAAARTKRKAAANKINALPNLSNTNKIRFKRELQTATNINNVVKRATNAQYKETSETFNGNSTQTATRKSVRERARNLNEQIARANRRAG
jgi:hypothetical protein